MVLLLYSCSHKPVEPEQSAQAFSLSTKMQENLETAEAKLEPTLLRLNFYGKITSDYNKLVEIFPIVGGSVNKVYVELGDYVTKGQILATIRSTEVASFEKELEDARTDVLIATNNLKVTQELFQGKLNTERDVIEARGQLEKAQSQLQRTLKTYEIYSMKPGAIYEVRAPISGFIIQKNINEGMLLRSDKSDNIFDITEISEVWAIANINESDIGQIKMGMDAVVTTLSYPDKQFLGKVDKIYNLIDPETKAMKVRIKLDNKDFLLKPEMRCNLLLSTTENQQKIAIPSSSIVFDKSKHYVMVIDDDKKIETREVFIYRENGPVTYLQSGVQPGEKVLTNRQLLVYDAIND